MASLSGHQATGIDFSSAIEEYTLKQKAAARNHILVASCRWITLMAVFWLCVFSWLRMSFGIFGCALAFIWAILSCLALHQSPPGAFIVYQSHKAVSQFIPLGEDWALFFYNTCICTGIIGTSLDLGGIYSPSIYWFALIPIATGLHSRPQSKAVFNWTVVSMIFILAFTGEFMWFGFCDARMGTLAQFGSTLTCVMLSSIVVTGAMMTHTFKMRELALERSLNTLLVERFKAPIEERYNTVASLSHELRTPIHGMLANSELLLECMDQMELGDEDVPSAVAITRKTQTFCDASSYAKAIKKNGHILLEQFNEVLSMSKSRNHMTPKSSFIFRRDIVEKLQLMSIHVKYENEVVYAIDEKIANATLYGRPTGIVQICRNLINNAQAVTRKDGTVTVQAKITHLSGDVKRSSTEFYKDLPKSFEAFLRDKTGIWLAITVMDEGPGMMEEDIAKIFKPYTSNTIGGTGLGLVLCKALTLSMGGMIDCVSPSSVGIGSAFSIVIPMEVRHQPSMIGEGREADSSLDRVEWPKDTLSVLVVDDNQVNLNIMRNYMRRFHGECTHGHMNIEYARDGTKAVLAGTRKRYDIILMDLYMPGMDGFEASKRILEHQRLNGLNQSIVVAQTAHVFAEQMEKCSKAGMRYHLEKPFNRASLYNILKKCIEDITARKEVNS